jgi:cytochrome c-type protein NapB
MRGIMRSIILPALGLVLVFIFVAVGCAGPGGTPDTEIGLSKVSVFEDPSPAPVADNQAEPGGTTLLPRAFPGSPPAVPHIVADYLPITRDENLCFDCHQVQVEDWSEGDPTPIPASHYVDLRNAPTKFQDAPVGARYVCVTCHVAQTEATPLVKISSAN